MPELDEFTLIERLFRPLTGNHPGALGLQDDAALLNCPPGKTLVMTTDAIVAGVHFLPDDPADLIARKLIRVNLSDLAAMGARPVGMLLAACFPKKVKSSWLDAFASGLKADHEVFGVPLLGGDTVATPGPASFALTALGMVKKGGELRRSNARSGDRIWVSGTIGDAAFGLQVATGRMKRLTSRHQSYLLNRYQLPQPRLALGHALVGIAHAAMDISDGLAGDLSHICRASGVGAVLNVPEIPFSPAVRAILGKDKSGIATVLTGGDDYELLFTAPISCDRRLASLSARLGLRLSPIGRIIKGTEVRLEGPDGAVMALPTGRHSGGYRHFGA